MKESHLLTFTKISLYPARQTLASRAISSKHTFTQSQQLSLTALKIRFNLPCQEFTEYLEEMPKIKKALKLKHVPHFTTIQKVFIRPATAIWRVLLKLTPSFPEGNPLGWMLQAMSETTPVITTP